LPSTLKRAGLLFDLVKLTPDTRVSQNTSPVGQVPGRAHGPKEFIVTGRFVAVGPEPANSREEAMNHSHSSAHSRSSSVPLAARSVVSFASI
jgi:hypothetical protein